MASSSFGSGVLSSSDVLCDPTVVMSPKEMSECLEHGRIPLILPPVSVFHLVYLNWAHTFALDVCSTSWPSIPPWEHILITYKKNEPGKVIPREHAVTVSLVQQPSVVCGSSMDSYLTRKQFKIKMVKRQPRKMEHDRYNGEVLLLLLCTVCLVLWSYQENNLVGFE